jgi:osmotically-inducible protein OsmY
LTQRSLLLIQAGVFVPSEQQADFELKSRIDDLFRDSGHQFGRQIQSSHDHGVVVLQGRVETYYHKQMAQEMLRRLDGVARVVNLLEVHWGEPAGPAALCEASDTVLSQMQI